MAPRISAVSSVRQETRWLSVICGGLEWLLPGSHVRLLIRRPVVQQIPAVTSLCGLAVYHNDVFPVIDLPRFLCGETVDSRGRRQWGALCGPENNPVLFLVEDHRGIMEIPPEEVEWIREVDNDGAGFLGVVDRDGRRLTLIDPLRFGRFIPKPPVEAELRIGPFSPSVVDERDDLNYEPRQLMLLAADGLTQYAVPAGDIYHIDRVLTAPGGGIPFLGELTTNAPTNVETVSEKEKKRALCCEVRKNGRRMRFACTDLLGWLWIRESEISPWTGMECFRMSGSIRIEGENRSVMVVDVGGFEAECWSPVIEEDPYDDDAVAGDKIMPDEERLELVKIRAGKELAALPLASLYMIYSFRRARVHPISSAKAAVTGLLEREGQFLTIVDLGLLLGGKATAARPENRLLEVWTEHGRLALLAEEVFEPISVKTGDIVSASSSPTGDADNGFAASVWREPGEGAVTVLDLDRLILSLKKTVEHV